MHHFVTDKVSFDALWGITQLGNGSAAKRMYRHIATFAASTNSLYSEIVCSKAKSLDDAVA